MTNTWRELLYPAEWGFRFAITALLVAIINSLSSIDYALLYYALWIGMAICFLLQLRITILFILGKIPAQGLSNA